MNNDQIYAAITGIDEKYLSASEDAGAVATSIRAAKRKRNTAVLSLCACLLLAAVAVGPVRLWLNGAAPSVDPTLMPVPSDCTNANETITTRSVNETVSDLSETNPDQTTTNPDRNNSEPATTPITERDTANPPETNPEPVTQKADDITEAPPSTEAEPTTLSGAPSYNGPKRLKAAIEDNVCGWIRYNGAYYLQDDWSNGNAIEKCEPVSISSAVEGNLELLGLTGTVFLVTDDDNYPGCLLLKTDSGRNIVFIPVPESD